MSRFGAGWLADACEWLGLVHLAERLRGKPPVIQLTSAAQEQLCSVAEQSQLRTRPCVRASIAPVGPAGYWHSLDWEFDPLRPDDLRVRCGRVDCVISQSQFVYLQGTVVDWTSENGEQGFKFSRPNVTVENKRLTQDWIDEHDRAFREEVRRKSDREISLLKRAADAAPEDDGAQLKLADHMVYCGRYSAAVKVYELVLRRSPRTMSAYLGLAKALTQLRDRDRALQILAAAWELAKSLKDDPAQTKIRQMVGWAKKIPSYRGKPATD